jgi:hypothetical protein
MGAEQLVNLIGSFMKGKIAAEDRKTKREIDRETLDTLKEQRKAQSDLLKFKVKDAEYKQKWLDVLMRGGVLAPQQPAAAPKESVTDYMANPELINLHRSDMPSSQPAQQVQPGAGGLGSMDPWQIVGLSELTGVPLLDAVKFKETVRKNDMLEDQGWSRIEETKKNNAFNQALAGQETIQVPVTDATGATYTIRIPKYPGLAGGGKKPSLNLNPSGPGGVQTTPGINERIITPDELPLWVKTDTMKVAPPGMTPAQANKEGYVKITEGQKTGIKDFAMIQNVLNRTDALIQKVYPKSGGALDVGRLTRPVGAMLQTNTDAELLDGFIKGTLAPVIRSLGEKGTLANQDVERAIGLMPKLSDSVDVARGKIKQIRELIQNNKQVFLGGLPNTQTGSGGQGAAATKKQQIGRFTVEVH